MSKETKFQPDQNEEALLPFKGKHAPLDKIMLLFPVSVLVCLLPSTIGIRLWNQIPEIVTTGIVNARGEDDSMPRAILVYGLPALVCLINIICHVQLFLHQRRKKLPPGFVRLMGRLGLPVIAVFAIASFILLGAGESPGGGHLLACVSGMFLLFCGSLVLDFTGGGIPGIIVANPDPESIPSFAGKDQYFWLGSFYMLACLLVLGADMAFGLNSTVFSILFMIAGAVPVILILRSRRNLDS